MFAPEVVRVVDGACSDFEKSFLVVFDVWVITSEVSVDVDGEVGHAVFDRDLQNCFPVSFWAVPLSSKRACKAGCSQSPEYPMHRSLSAQEQSKTFFRE